MGLTAEKEQEVGTEGCWRVQMEAFLPWVFSLFAFCSCDKDHDQKVLGKRKVVWFIHTDCIHH